MKRQRTSRALHSDVRSMSLAAVAFGVLLMFASAATAQTVSNAFGGMSENSDQPIDIEADTLTVFDAKKLATFKGNVKAVQGPTTLRSSELHVHYIGGAEKFAGGKKEAKPAPSEAPANTAENAQSRINKIEARGQVVITSEDDQTTTSDWAIYDVPAQLVTVGGNVVLSQGQNVLKGDRLVIDLQTGEARFANTGAAAAGAAEAGGGRGRVRALFLPKDGGPAKDKKGEGAAGALQTQSGVPVGNGAPSQPVPEVR